MPGRRWCCSAVLALALILVVASCGGSSATPDGSVPVETLTVAQHAVTYTVPSSAMEPTIRCARPVVGCTGSANDRVVVEEPARQIQRQDILVFRTPGRAATECGESGVFVKRVIGLPGESVREDDFGVIWIRGPHSDRWVKLSEPYVTAPRRLADTEHFGRTWQVRAGDYFTMGDNRAESCDSRIWGGVPRANVIGKVVKILRPG